MKQLSSSAKACERSDSIFLKEESRICIIEPKEGKKKLHKIWFKLCFCSVYNNTFFIFWCSKIKIIIGLQLLIFCFTLLHINTDWSDDFLCPTICIFFRDSIQISTLFQGLRYSLSVLMNEYTLYWSKYFRSTFWSFTTELC